MLFETAADVFLFARAGVFKGVYSMNQPVVAAPVSIIKRDGTRVAFEPARIQSAIQRAGKVTAEFGDDEALLLTSQVLKVLRHRFPQEPPQIEQIQDVVEQALISANHFTTLRAYAVYREQRSRLRQDRKTVVDVTASVNEYLEQTDWRVSANANQGYSLGGLILNLSGKVIANYWLSQVYPLRWGRPIVTAASISMIWICWPVTAPAGRCGCCCMRD